MEVESHNEHRNLSHQKTAWPLHSSRAFSFKSFAMPRLISFSGGRSSAMMLKIIADNGFCDDDFVLFANTGKERPETLDFVHEVGNRWGIPIVWIEGTFGPYNLETGTMVESVGFKVVDYHNASRNGEPFSAMNSWVNCGHVPNRVTRFCTKYLKVIPMKRYLESLGIDDFDNVMGIRFDEPARYRKYKGDGTFPLVDMRITEADVFRFWSAQPFDLQLKQYEGNCDLCHLKSLKKLKTIIAEQGEQISDWWIKEERKTNSTFLTGIDFSILTEIATNRRFSKSIDTRAMIEHDLFSISCFCGD